MAPDWNAVLDVLEARIEAHRAVLEGSPAVTPYELPAEIGPLPLELAGRACVILARQQELEATLTAEMAELRNLFDRHASAASAVPIYLDARA
jgi:hypothetical protein